MKRSAARLLCAAAALLLLACGAYALTSGDSLITLSYLTEQILPDALRQGEKAADGKLQESYDQAKNTLDGLQAGYLGKPTGEEGSGAYSPTLQARDWNEGDTAELPTGSGVLMLEGTVTVSHSGVVIDVTDGSEAASGAKLVPGHRYLVGEDTLARFTVLSGAASMGVQGSWTLTEGEGAATPFYDVCRTDWYYAPVAYVYENALFSGMDAHHFGPYAAMDRAMLMTVLYQMAGAPEEEMAAADVSFSDVPDSAWYASYVKWGAAQGITAGTGPNTFSPRQQVTRQQVVALLYSFAVNYLGLPQGGRADLSAYRDLDQADAWALDALSWAVAEGVVSSSSADALTLSPLKPANRAEVAAMLRAFSEKIL